MNIISNDLLKLALLWVIQHDFFANHYPHMKIFTIEIDKDHYNNAVIKFQKCANVPVNLDSSDDFLNKIDNSKIPTFYYLDAHL